MTLTEDITREEKEIGEKDFAEKYEVHTLANVIAEIKDEQVSYL